MKARRITLITVLAVLGSNFTAALASDYITLNREASSSQSSAVSSTNISITKTSNPPSSHPSIDKNNIEKIKKLQLITKNKVKRIPVEPVAVVPLTVSNKTDNNSYSLSSGISLEENIVAWGKKAGWKVIWESSAPIERMPGT